MVVVRQYFKVFFFIWVKVISTHASPLGIPRDIYRVTSQIKSQSVYHLGVVNHFGSAVVLVLLRSLISFRLMYPYALYYLEIRI